MSARTRIFKKTMSLLCVPHDSREDIVPHNIRGDMVPHNIRKDLNRKRHRPSETTNGLKVVASNPFKNEREIMRISGLRTRDEASSRKRRHNIEEEGLAKCQILATKKPRKTNEETNNIKRKRAKLEAIKHQDSASRGERFGLSYKIIKKGRRENQDSPSKPTSASGGGAVRSTTLLHNVLKPLSLDRFIFHKKLGQGSFGKVFLASDRARGHQVAVKVVKKRPLLKNNRIEQAINEKRVLELAGGSPFLTFSYATFQTADYICYVMEYLRGGDLNSFIAASAPLHTSTTRFLTAEIICGLQYLHAIGIIHRDISPENIFLDSTGHIKIGDYGLCATNVTGDNKASGCVGSEKYIAPEVFSQDSYDAAVDWFSLGVLMYKMSTGKYPFYSGDDWPTLMWSVLHKPPAYPEELSPRLKDVIDQLLCKNGKTRLAFGTQIRKHLFFAPIDWVRLEAGKISPPFYMEPAPVMDSSYSIPLGHFLSQREAQKPPITPESQKIFWGFSYTSKRWRQLQHQVRSASQSIVPPRKIRILEVPMSSTSSSPSYSTSSSSSSSSIASFSSKTSPSSS